MPSTPASIETVLRLAAAASRRAQRLRGSNQVVRVDRAIACCERNVIKTVGDVQALLNGILDVISRAKRGDAIGFVPGVAAGRMITLLTPAQVAAISTGAEVAGVVIPAGAIVLGAYAVLEPLISERATYDTLSLVGQALANYQRTKIRTKTKVTDCEQCVRDSALSQLHRRQRQKVKILRRV